MATFELSPLFRSASFGFDRLPATGQPAYNILKLDEDNYRINLAVPGLRHDEITIETREGALWLKAERRADPHHNQYLHRGFGLDGFHWTFQLPEHVKVKDASLEMGILHVNLVRELPDALKPRRIEIRFDADGERVIEDASKAA